MSCAKSQLCTALESPYSLLSLFDMLRFYAETFVRMNRKLEAYKHEIQVLEQSPLTESVRQNMLSHSRAMLADCLEWSLDSVVDQCYRIQQALQKDTPMPLEMARLYEELQHRVEDELRRNLIMLIPPAKSALYLVKYPFGSEVADQFPSTLLDIEEASKSYATNRNTACVLHLQRVMEAGLHVLGQNIGVDIAENRTWDAILQKIDPELRKGYTDKSPFFKSHEQKCAEAAVLLRSVKIAWRNPTMHVGNVYDEEKAMEVYTAVRAFMRHLATW